MDVFVLVFAVVFIAGFAIRGMWRAATSWRCPECQTRIPLKAVRCAACGAALNPEPG